MTLSVMGLSSLATQVLGRSKGECYSFHFFEMSLLLAIKHSIIFELLKNHKFFLYQLELWCSKVKICNVRFTWLC